MKKGRKRKLEALDGPKKPSVISTNSPKKPSSPAKKKGRKHNPWSDSKGSDAGDSDRSDIDMDASFGNVVEREKAPRRAAGQLLCICILSWSLVFNDDDNHFTTLYGTTQVSRYQKDEPFWILLKQT